MLCEILVGIFYNNNWIIEIYVPSPYVKTVHTTGLHYHAARIKVNLDAYRVTKSPLLRGFVFFLSSFCGFSHLSGFFLFISTFLEFMNCTQDRCEV